MNIETTNPELEKRLLELKELVLGEGAFLHPRLTVCERSGNLDIRSSLDASRSDPLIKIPAACLPSLASFELYSCDDDICIRSASAGTSPLQVRCMEAMLATYNICGKLADARENSPWFGLAPYPEILQALLNLRNGARKIDEKRLLLADNRLDELLLSAFLGSRHFNLASRNSQVLMPFIDYINHHHLATGFMLGDAAGTPFLYVNNAKPQSGSDEVFVSYFQMMDPIDSWLNYFFVDESATIVKSVPMLIEIGSGKQIRVLALFAGRKQAPPEHLKDLAPFLPLIIDKSEHHLTVSRLIIPHEKAPLALRRILQALILTLCPGLEKSALRNRVEKAEAELIEANQRFYHDLGDKVGVLLKERQTDTPLNRVQRIVELQLAKIAAYQQRLEKMAETGGRNIQNQ